MQGRQANRTSARTIAATHPLRRLGWLLALGAAAATLFPTFAHGQSLRGSRPSVEKMYNFAVRHGVAFRRTPETIAADAAAGRLVVLGGSLDYELTGGVGWPYVTPETKRFVEAFAEQFSAVCEMPLVITSATRPLSRQPRNASPQSVHPTGIAIDLRRPPGGPCLDWTRQALLALENRGVIEATEERRPVHFHIAVLAPRGGTVQLPVLRVAGQDPVAKRPTWLAMRASYHAPVVAAVAESEGEGENGFRSGLRLMAGRVRSAFARALFLPGAESPGVLPGAQAAGVVVADGDVAVNAPSAAPGTTAGATSGATTSATAGATTAAAAPATRTYRVRQGDTLWEIARRNGTSVDELLAANGLRRNTSIRPGDTLRIPAR